MTSELLRQLSALSHFSLEQFDLLAKAAQMINAPAGHAIVKHGDASADLYGTLRGSLKIQRDTPYGLFKLARLHPG